jgi:hypothetical protein
MQLDFFGGGAWVAEKLATVGICEGGTFEIGCQVGGEGGGADCSGCALSSSSVPQFVQNRLPGSRFWPHFVQ